MRHLLQAFSTGIFITTLLLAFIYFYTGSDENNLNAPSPPSSDEMIADLENEGYVVVTKEEWKEKNQVSETSSSGTEQEKTIRSLTMQVSEGMDSSDVSSLLEEAAIIKDSNAFNTYLRENGYSKQLQTGTILVNDQMSQPELAETLTSP